MPLRRLIALRRSEVASGRDRVTSRGCLRACLGGKAAPLGSPVAKVLRNGMLGGVASVGELAIAGRLVGVGRGLVVLRRRLVAVGGRLVGVRERLIGIGERLILV
jgi:hypothetical protein